jgi:hypothetical protein
MYRWQNRLLPLLLPLALVASALAAEPGDTAAVTPPPAAAEPTESYGNLASSKPLAAALAAVLDEGRRRAAELATGFATATAAGDQIAALAAQRELNELKSGTEVRLLEVQAEFARREGRLEAAQRIADTIATLRLPAPDPQPQSRPAPVTDAPQR